ncbi:histidine phosphatase family protein [Clostridium gasigenes]|uniref:histidine phosphatase family protein n=1 Tax=Clostridium gasigenes TaxID=94869 RepID=UPI001C0C45F7|nr:histidine phosphatase family protein [Clostridium gasigenes]MBU3106302.1 phosphoglycerate mutase family protein [Clostridium gasigenes]
MTQFYFIRHGEQDWDIVEKHNLKGQAIDLIPLTQNGINQANRAAKDIRICGSDIIICSPYTRALQTASIISKNTGIDLSVEFDLREWQSDLTFDYDSKGQLIELWHDYLLHNGVYPQGEVKPWETKENLKKRINSVLIKYSNYSKVIVVAHAEIFASLISTDEILHCSILEYTQN